MSGPAFPEWLAIRALDREVIVRVDDGEVRAAVVAPFAAMAGPTGARCFDVSVSRAGDRYEIAGGAGPTLAGTVDDIAWGARYHVTRKLMADRTDLLWLHASCAVHPNGAVIFAGPSAAGKSTLADALVRRGCDLAGDDLVPVDPMSGLVHPLPMMPAVRIATDESLPIDGVRALPKIESRVSDDRIARSPVLPTLVIFPAYHPDAFEWSPCGPAAAAAELLRNCLNIRDHGEAGVRALARMTATCRAARVRYHDPEDVMRSIDESFDLVDLASA